MKPLNIAVCLSGESRTWDKCIPSLKNFFSSTLHKFTFFAHTWTDSCYYKEKLGIEKHVKEDLFNRMMSLIDYETIAIDDKNILTFGDKATFSNSFSPDSPKNNLLNINKPTTFAHMSYSILKANELKQQYEYTNDMRFDLVIRTRHDLCYDPTCKFDNFLPEKPLPTALYCENYYFPNEYYLPHINDIFYFGNSRIMDVVDGFYRYYGTGKFYQMVGENFNDHAYSVSGYNVNLYKWVVTKNILIRNLPIRFCTVFRKNAENYDWVTEYKNIQKTDRDLFL